MADEYGDKTEAPTPRRRAEAREQGNVARSTDLTAAVLLIGMLVLLKWYGPGLIVAMQALVEQMLGEASITQLYPEAIGSSLWLAAVAAGRALAPLFVGVVLIAIVVNLAQVGLFFNT